MKKFKSLVLAVMGLLCCMSVTAEDFVVDGIYYYITSSRNKTVAVTYRGTYYNEYSNEYSGEVTIPKSVTYNGHTYSVTSIGILAFEGCSSLTSVEIPYSVTSIGNLAFEGCSSLTSVEIPNSVTSIGYYAFQSCSSLTSIVVAPNNPKYDSRDNCNAIIESESNTLIAGCMNSTIPNSVTSIGGYAFSSCSSLTSVEIPNSVTSIGGYAFSSCSSLTSVEIPNSVTSIGDAAFSGCSSLTSVEIPNSVTSIGDDAFSYCSSLTSVELPNSVTSIGEWTFSYCSSLTSVEIPNSVTSIGGSAFSCCLSLTSVELPNSVTSIGPYAFSSCSSLTSVELPNSVTSIGSYAFRNCSALLSIISYIPEVKLFSTDVSVFGGVDKENCTLYVPYGAKSTYASTDGWKDFTNIVEMGRYYDLTVSAAGYATLYLDYATEIPEGVEVYTAKEVDGIWLKMAQVGDVLPANTAVIVKAPAGTYTFVQTATETSTIADNLLKGSATDAYIDVPSNSKAFVLSMVDDEVGMYLAKLTDGRFLNNANKAYLLLDNNKLGLSDEELDTSVGGAQLSLRFDFGSATGIDAVQTETEKVIYDLYGRKVNQITGSGLYIIGGKKVYVR